MTLLTILTVESVVLGRAQVLSESKTDSLIKSKHGNIEKKKKKKREY